MRTSWPTALVVLALAPGALNAQTDALPPLPRGEANVQGVVVDRTTGAVVPEVTVLLRVRGGLQGAVRLTGENGGFRFASVPLGAYDLEIRRIGFHEVNLSLETTEGAFVNVEIGLVPAAVELEPIVVTSARRDRLGWVGFRDRQQSTAGRFFTRDEIQRHRVTQVSQLFRGVAGFRTIPSRDGHHTAVVGRGNCQPSLYLDGVRMPNTGVGQLDQILTPDHLEGLEIYSGSQTPGQFQAGRCGTVVAWTHTPSGMEGHPFQWRRLLVAGGIATAVMTLFF